MKKRILFVCLGNICRSPAAEGIMQDLIKKSNVKNTLSCDSAGTSGYHIGDLPDSRMRKHAKKRGYVLNSRARQFEEKDFEDFDCIVTMDDQNYQNVVKLASSQVAIDKVHKMTSYCTQHDVKEVPDPYYGGDSGFENVLDILEDACGNLLEKLKNG